MNILILQLNLHVNTTISNLIKHILTDPHKSFFKTADPLPGQT